MQIADLLKKNIVMIPVVASIIVGSFTGIKYVINLTDTINTNKQAIVNIERDFDVIQSDVNSIKQKLERAEGTWEMAENLYEVLADKVRQM